MIRPRRARRLAAPIVMTAVAAGCAAPAEPIHVNPPPQETPVSTSAPVAPPPTAIDYGRGNPPPPAQLPLPSGNGRIEKRADGTCVQHAVPSPCPAGAMCNPPPPHAVRCP